MFTCLYARNTSSIYYKFPDPRQSLSSPQIPYRDSRLRMGTLPWLATVTSYWVYPNQRAVWLKYIWLNDVQIAYTNSGSWRKMG